MIDSFFSQEGNWFILSKFLQSLFKHMWVPVS